MIKTEIKPVYNGSELTAIEKTVKIIGVCVYKKKVLYIKNDGEYLLNVI